MREARYPTAVPESSAWVVLKKLGEGGHGAVYLARTPAGETVAVKLLLPETDTGALEREAALLLRLKHPGIAGIQGYLKDSSAIFGVDRGPCFWMENVSGVDVLTAAKGLSGGRDDAILRWFQQALEALAYLHSQKVLHGDLTPLNLKIDADGRLKFLDFGLASIGRSERLPHDGTLFYMAPERFQGVQDEAGDLFSLGTVIYEALAGVHPREGARSLSAMLRLVPKPLAEVVPGLAARHGLEARVIDRMIRPAASERFLSVREVLQALESRMVPGPSSEEVSYYSRIFFGAEGSLQDVERALDSILEKSRFSAVHGITGVGRTRFLNEVAFRAALRGLRVVDVAPRRFREELARMARVGPEPAVYLFRDLQEVPRSELADLVALRRSAWPAAGLFAVFEWNDDAIDPENLRLLSHSPAGAAWDDVVLTDLSPDDARAFLAGALGEETAAEVSPALFGKTRGNPRLLLEWVALFRKRGWTSRRHFPKDWLESEEATGGAEGLLQGRIEGLDASERTIAEALSLAEGPAGLEEILQVLRGLEPAPGDDEAPSWARIAALERLVGGGYVLMEPDAEGLATYRLALPSLARALAGGKSPEAIKNLHGLWLEALRHEDDASPLKIGHVIAGGDLERTVRAAAALAERLRREEKYRAALAVAERALGAPGVAEDPVSESRLLRLKANVLNDSGRYGEALECCERVYAMAAADEPQSLKKAKYWLVTGLIHENLGNVPEALRRFEECRQASEALVGAERRYYEIRSLTLAGKQLFALGRKGEAVARYEEALGLGPSGREKAEICRNMAAAVFSGDWDRARRFLDEAAGLYQTQGDHRGEFAAHLLRGNLALERDLPEEGKAAYARAEAIALSHKDDLLLARVWNNQGALARKLGRLAEALEYCGRSLEVFRSLGSPGDLAGSLKQNVVTESELGRFDQAERLVGELESMAHGDPRLAAIRDEARARFEFYRTAPVLPGGDHPSDWNVEAVLERLEADGTESGRIREMLNRIYDALPKGLQVTFIDRYDYRTWVLSESKGDGS